MNETPPDHLVQAIAQLRRLFPEWRLGQLIANLATAAGCPDAEALWDVEDEQLLTAARRLIANNSGRLSARA